MPSDLVKFLYLLAFISITFAFFRSRDESLPQRRAYEYPNIGAMMRTFGKRAYHASTDELPNFAGWMRGKRFDQDYTLY
ncbi:unnamed protein product, partial [Mesorhabditis belari]|uniref:Uncharacterized protein n=1 Tax=Mesorhabditis belari TaxID=2138241 RepID=A0AAF3FL56_9BILA